MQMQHAPSDRVATATLNVIFPGAGDHDHGGRDHDLDLRLQQRLDPGRRPRVLRDGARRAVLPLSRTAQRRQGAGVADCCCRALWAAAAGVAADLRRRRPGRYGNLYSNLLDYVISAALIFYILTIAGVFRLRATRPEIATALPGVRLSGRAGAVHRRRRDHSCGAVHLPDRDDVAGADHRAARSAGVFRMAPAGRAGVG